MISINSDVEFTDCRAQTLMLQEFAARDLETSFSFWFFCGNEKTWRVFGRNQEFTPCRDVFLRLAQAGLLDTIHSLGGRHPNWQPDYDRKTIEGAYEKLKEYKLNFPVFTNHGVTLDRQNIGGSIATYQEGDLPGSDLYHLDLTENAGVRFFWLDPDYVIEPGFLAATANRSNSLFVTDQARDGRPLLRFRRFMGRLSSGPALENLPDQLDQLFSAGNGVYAVIYQHLGVARRIDGSPEAASIPPLPARVATKLDELAAAQKRRELLVTTTARLLMHAALMCARPWEVKSAPGRVDVVFDTQMNIGDTRFDLVPETLAGWVIPWPMGTRVRAWLGKDELDIQRFSVGSTWYAGFPWRKIDMAGILKEIKLLSGFQRHGAQIEFDKEQV